VNLFIYLFIRQSTSRYLCNWPKSSVIAENKSVTFAFNIAYLATARAAQNIFLQQDLSFANAAKQAVSHRCRQNDMPRRYDHFGIFW